MDLQCILCIANSSYAVKTPKDEVTCNIYWNFYKILKIWKSFPQDGRFWDQMGGRETTSQSRSLPFKTGGLEHMKENHPTGLHGFKSKKKRVKQDSGNDDNKQITITCTRCSITDVISSVVPGQIRFPDSNKVLDTCNAGQLQSRHICKGGNNWGITEQDTTVTVRTLTREISQMTTVVENLKVARSLGKTKSIKLPREHTPNRNYQHLILLPRRRRSVITNRIIGWCHNRSGHTGRNMTLKVTSTIKW